MAKFCHPPPTPSLIMQYKSCFMPTCSVNNLIRQSNVVQQLDPTHVQTIATVWNYVDNLIECVADISNDKHDE